LCYLFSGLTCWTDRDGADVTTSGDRASVFASAHFGGCLAHRDEAIAVHAAVEKIARRKLSDLDPDSALGAILGFDSPKGADSLDAVEQLMALEEEFGEGLVPDQSDVSAATWRKAVMAALLGRAVRYCKWEPDTISVRSARGVINERVRWREGCSCAVGHGAVQQRDAADEVRAGDSRRGPRS